jgi:uncharacterized protein YbjT (DUF2867 family)
MKRILITGATGNIGKEVIRHLFLQQTQHHIIAGVRNLANAKAKFMNFPDLDFVFFDFEHPETFDDTLENIDTIFLLRPPHISDIATFFQPLVDKLMSHKIQEVLFLSVQGAEKSKVIPHNKIERLLLGSNINYIFLRPSYFMQNLTTTLYEDIASKRKIILPAGKAKFNWIDVDNVGAISALLLHDFIKHQNQAIELTGLENLNFGEVTKIISDEIDTEIQYQNMNPVSYYFLKKRESVPPAMIIVMIMLHFLPRFQKPPKISQIYEALTDKKPTSLAEFVLREKDLFDTDS